MPDPEGEEEIYREEGRDDAVEDDEISPEEAGFMQGYEEASEEKKEEEKKKEKEEKEEKEN